MTTREQRLFALLVVVALFALGDLGWSFLKKSSNDAVSPNRPTPEHARAAVNAIVPRIENDPSGFRALVATARLPIQRPIVTRYEEPKTRATLEGNLPTLVYTGYLALPDGDHAVINGTGYAVGDTVEETGERVVAISAEAVELFAPQTEARRSVLFTEELPAAYAFPAAEPSTPAAGFATPSTSLPDGGRSKTASSGSASGSTASTPSELREVPIARAWSRLSEAGVVPEIRKEVLNSPVSHGLESNRRFEKAATAVRP